MTATGKGKFIRFFIENSDGETFELDGHGTFEFEMPDVTEDNQEVIDCVKNMKPVEITGTLTSNVFNRFWRWFSIYMPGTLFSYN